jgi:putative DNA primase/helicase
MDNHIDQFFDAMAREGCAPRDRSDIIADDKRHRIACADDKRGDKTLVYQFKIDDDFSVGWFRSFKFGARAGQTVTFISKANKKLSAEEKAAYAEKQLAWKRIQAAEAKKREQRQKRLALRLKRAVSKMPKAGAHPYLDRKRVAAHGLRIRKKNNELIIPVYQADGMPWSLQRITERGDKWFMSGGKIRCGYYPLAEAADDKSVIVIAEGFATSASVREALRVPTICAFNAGNLEPVAKAMRQKYPNSRIVIAADNDRFTATGNTGITKGKEAALAVNGFVVYPDFTDDDKSGTDWNDYITAHGADQLRDKIRLIEDVTAKAGVGGEASGDVVSSVQAPHLPSEIRGDWRDGLQYKGNELLKGSFTNLVLFAQHHPWFEGVFRLNDFQKDIYVAKCPKWQDQQTFRVKRLDDFEITACAAQMEQFGVTSDINKVMRAIAHAAEKNKFHPARDYFDALKWDGTERLKGWLATYLGSHDDDEDYLSFIGTKWLTAAVKRIYEPGCKFDHVLVLEGSQGRGKSTALEQMATFAGETYFTDNVKISDISRDNTIMMLQGSVIVELAELAGFNKKDDEEIKGWITLKVDRCRRPYDKVVSHFPRQFVLSATTNNYDYLKDPTGNRRYWPTKTGELNIELIKRDSTQLWAEAVSLYKSGLYVGPTEEEQVLAKAAQEKRLAVDSWEDDVLSALNNIPTYNGFKLRAVLTEMGLNLRDRDYKTERRVCSILRASGYENRAVWGDGKTEKLWFRA